MPAYLASLSTARTRFCRAKTSPAAFLPASTPDITFNLNGYLNGAREGESKWTVEHFIPDFMQGRQECFTRLMVSINIDK